MVEEKRKRTNEGEKRILIELPALATQIFGWQEVIKQQQEAITKIAKQAEAVTAIAKPALEKTVRNLQIAHQQFSNVAKQLLELDFSPIVQQVALAQSLTQQVLRNIQSVISPEFFDALKRIGEKYIEIDKSDFEYKWLKSVPHLFFLHVYTEYKEGGNDKATEYLMKALQEESSIEELKTNLEHFDYYTQRKIIIDQALDAHKEGKYALSIPTLMTQIDGVFIQLALDLGVWKVEEEPTGVKVVTKKGGKKKIEEIDDYFRDYYGRFMGKSSVRAGVLHGYDIDYASNDELSAKVIWILFEALNVIEEIKNNQQKHLPETI
ncbi:MAG TPA: hypothetical protein C5S37_01385 [Methanophagales archaeon]|nr:hypothetical protein [Methanophagales archaeon]